MTFITTFIGSMQLRINFNKTAGFIKIYDGIRYLVLFSYLYDKICDKIKFLMKKWKKVLQIALNIILQKSELIHNILSLLNRILIFHNVIILIKSVVNENKSK